MFFGENRWYDHHPKLKYAVACIEEADAELRNKLVNLIILHAAEMNISKKRREPKLYRRWYDHAPTFKLAMEYFQNCNDDKRLEMAEHIITYARILSKNTVST